MSDFRDYPNHILSEYHNMRCEYVKELTEQLRQAQHHLKEIEMEMDRRWGELPADTTDDSHPRPAATSAPSTSGHPRAPHPAAQHPTYGT